MTPPDVRPDEIPDVTPGPGNPQGVHWMILGQVYSPKIVTEDLFAWHATLPIDSFVPPHIHHNQQEFIHISQGWLDLTIGGARKRARAGDTVALPQGVPHGIFNNAGVVVEALFWVRPRAGLDQMFRTLHNMDRPDRVARASAGYGVEFLPPMRAWDWLG